MRLRTLDFEVPVFADSYFSCVSCLPSGNAFSPLPPYAADFSYINNKGEMISLESTLLFGLEFFLRGTGGGSLSTTENDVFPIPLNHWNSETLEEHRRCHHQSGLR